MRTPKVAGNTPSALDLNPGSYDWCNCGLSKTQPFCDGSHQTTQIKPTRFTVMKKKRVVLCNCKMSLNRPFCDGAHKTLQGKHAKKEP